MPKTNLAELVLRSILLFLFGESGTGKTASTANLIIQNPDAGHYIYNETTGLATLKAMGVTEIWEVYREDPKELMEAVKQCISLDLEWVVIDTVSTWYQKILSDYINDTKTKYALGEVPREAYNYCLQWLRDLLLVCTEVVASGTTVIMICHERPVMSGERLVYRPALPGQAPEHVLQRCHCVLRTVREKEGSENRYYFTVPESPHVGKDLLGVVKGRMANDVTKLLATFPKDAGGASLNQRPMTSTDSPSDSKPLEASSIPIDDDGNSISDQAPPALPVSQRQLRYLQKLCLDAGESTAYLATYCNNSLGCDLLELTEDKVGEVTEHLTDLIDKNPQNKTPF